MMYLIQLLWKGDANYTMNREKILGRIYHFRDNFKQRSLQRKFNINIGEYSYGTPIIHFGNLEGTKCIIGKFCSIGKNVHVYLGGNHRIDWISTYPFPVKFKWAKDKGEYRVSKGDVIIGNDVWIGSDVTILSGVTIGNGAVIGAGAVVAKDVPAYAVAVGNPATVVKYRFKADEIDYLEKMQWWNLSIEKIEKLIDDLLNDDVCTFKKNLEEIISEEQY